MLEVPQAYLYSLSLQQLSVVIDKLTPKSILYGFSVLGSAAALAWFSSGGLFGLSSYTRVLVLSLVTASVFVFALQQEEENLQKIMIGGAGYSAAVLLFSFWSAIDASGGQTMVSLLAASAVGAGLARYFERVQKVQAQKYYAILAVFVIGVSLITAADASAGKPQTTIQVENTTELSTDDMTKVGTVTAKNSFFFPKELEEPDIDSKICGQNDIDVYTRIDGYSYREDISGTEEFPIASEISRVSDTPRDSDKEQTQELSVRRGNSCDGRENVLLISTEDLDTSNLRVAE